MKEKVRALRADEIEVRVSQVTAKGCQLLLYKDARCDKRILDEVYGTMNWTNSYTVVNSNLYCTISIWDNEKKQWINKQDCGTESNTEKEKGEASDAFKRAAFNFGIGRELYTRIFIWLSVPTVESGQQAGGKPRYELQDRFAKFHVSHINTDNERELIEELQISDSNGNVVFTHPRRRSGSKALTEALAETAEKHTDPEAAYKAKPKEKPECDFKKAEPTDKSDSLIDDAGIDLIKTAIKHKCGTLAKGLPILTEVYTKYNIAATQEIKVSQLNAVIADIENFVWES